MCVRLESYESEEHQEIVRSYLNGRFENTAFCLLSPDGKERLSRSGRAPWMAFSQRGPRGGEDELAKSTIAAMEKVAKNYKPEGDVKTPVVQDFHSYRQALNVASGDQRLLLFVAAEKGAIEKLRKDLSTVLGDPELVGRFHTDLHDAKTDKDWQASLDKLGSKKGDRLLVIRADKFGQKGTVLAQLPVDVGSEKIKATLLKANQSFAKKEKRKVYSEHVSDGRREGVFFEGGVEYGEDRDGDGKIDHRGGQRGARPGGGDREGRRPPPPRRRRGE